MSKKMEVMMIRKTLQALVITALMLSVPVLAFAHGSQEKSKAATSTASSSSSSSGTAMAVKGPTPYPVPPPLPGGQQPTKKYPLNQLEVYKALPHYSQSPLLAKLVKEGKLPPLKQRLPQDPQVVPTASMSTGIGVYGGVWRDFSAVPTQGWNWWDGQTQGYFGINQIYSQGLLKDGPIYRLKGSANPLPNLASSYHWTDHGYKLIMHLVRGAKWSDGAPFTANDVMFTWKYLILNPNINSPTTRSTWQIDGKNIDLKEINKYEIEWIFPKPYAVTFLFDMCYPYFDPAPAHWLKKHLPAFNKNATYATFLNSMPPTKLPVPTMGPWVPVYLKPGTLLVMRRNPYFWKVDQAGHQLPYLNEVDFQKGTSGTGRTLNLLAGSGDHSNVENPSNMLTVMRKAHSAKSTFNLTWGPELDGYALEVNQSLNLGVSSPQQKAMRELFRKAKFRQALSYAIDRKGIGQSLVPGNFMRPFAGGIMPGSPYFNRKSVVYYAYSPSSAKALLAQLGFKDTNGDGYVNWTSGPLKGQDLQMSIIAAQDQHGGVSIMQALVPLFQSVGIKLHARVLTSPSRTQKIDSGTWQLNVNRLGQQWGTPFAFWQDIVPVSKVAPEWHRQGSKPRVLEPFEKQLIKIVRKAVFEPSFKKREALFAQYNNIYTKNCYSIGIVVGRYGLGMAKRFRNVPIGATAFMYNWTFENTTPYAIWVPKKLQVKEVFPNRVPVPSDYHNN